jgi:hypothetical protein
MFSIIGAVLFVCGCLYVACVVIDDYIRYHIETKNED